MTDSTFEWACENFGTARLGDPRRVVRLVAMAEQAARQPGGRVTEVFSSSAEREGAFRFLENSRIGVDNVAEALFEATARKCEDQKVVYVPLDATSLTLTDRLKHRELGHVGKFCPSRGLHAMTALAVDERGTTIGLLAQRWWAQIRRRKPLKRAFGNDYLKRETRHWFDAIADVSARLTEHARARPWFQLDRGGDCWPVLKMATEQEILLTVRSAHDRRLEARPGQRAYLHKTAKKLPALGHYRLQLPPRDKRRARVARMTLRAGTVTIRAWVAPSKHQPVSINVVAACEEGYRGRDRLCWILLTTAHVSSLDEAKTVVRGYSLRWRIEEFHRAWKNGLCRVEDTQLHSRAAIIKWATILGAVAARAVRLAHLLRSSPDLPASCEFTNYEVAAAFALANRKIERGKVLSLKDVIGLIADLGGFANKYSGGRPGATVIGRGLANVQNVALALKNMDEMR